MTWDEAVCSAAANDRDVALIYLVDLPELKVKLGFHHVLGTRLLKAAAGFGDPDCLNLLQERGCALDASVLIAAIAFDSHDCLDYALEHIEGDHDYSELLEEAISNTSFRCLEVLYDRGCVAELQQQRQKGSVWDLLEDGDIKQLAELEEQGIKCLRIMVENSGPPPTDKLRAAVASFRGVESLQYLRGLGGPWQPETMRNASWSVDAMRYAHENGCPWGHAVMSDFLRNLETLEYAHKNGCDYDNPARSSMLPSFPVLQYCWKHMDRGWVRQVVNNGVKLYHSSAAGEATSQGRTCDSCGHDDGDTKKSAARLDWRVPLFLVKEMKMSRSELGYLAPLAEIRLARAAALAQCFYEAGKCTREGRSGPWADVWAAMARCPEDIREKIASNAHLALPVRVPEISLPTMHHEEESSEENSEESSEESAGAPDPVV